MVGRVVPLLALVLAAGMASSDTTGASELVKPRRGGTVAVGLFGQLSCLNVLVAACRTDADPIWLTQTLEGAFEVAPDLTYRPNLVSRVTLTEEPFTLTYHIRPQARWSDGTPVTASDFVFTFQAFSEHVDLPENDPYRKVSGVRAVGPKTFRAVFRARAPDWRELFHVVLPSHALAGQDLTAVWRNGIDNPKTRQPIGSGPFLVERFEPDRQLTLVRNPRYWGPHSAYLDRVIFRFPRGLGEALRRGDADVAPAFPFTVPPYQSTSGEPGITVLFHPGLNWEHIAVRVGADGHPALRNALVRRALAYGINRGAIVRTLFAPLSPRLRPSDSAVFLTNSPFYRPNWKGYRYRPAEARRLLENAGCRRGADGIYACAGERLSFRFFHNGSYRELTARLVRDQLRPIGIEILPKLVPSGDYFASVLPAGDYDLSVFSWRYGPDPAGIVAIFRCGGSQNWTGYCDADVSRDLLESTQIVDANRRAALLNRVDARIARDVPVIPLYQSPLPPVAFRKGLRGVVPNHTREGVAWNSEDWWLDR